jgi:hypothetical protein
MPEAQPNLFKDSANRGQNKINLIYFLCRGAAYLITYLFLTLYK